MITLEAPMYMAVLTVLVLFFSGFFSGLIWFRRMFRNEIKEGNEERKIYTNMLLDEYNYVIQGELEFYRKAVLQSWMAAQEEAQNKRLADFYGDDETNESDDDPEDNDGGDGFLN